MRKRRLITVLPILILTATMLAGCMNNTSSKESYNVKVEEFKNFPGVQRVIGSTEEDYYVICDDVNKLAEYCDLKLPMDGTFKFVDISLMISDKEKAGHISMDAVDDAGDVFAHVNGVFVLPGNRNEDSVNYAYSKDQGATRETKSGTQIYISKDENEGSLCAYYEVRGINYQLIAEDTPNMEQKVLQLVEWTNKP